MEHLYSQMHGKLKKKKRDDKYDQTYHATSV